MDRGSVHASWGTRDTDPQPTPIPRASPENLRAPWTLTPRVRSPRVGSAPMLELPRFVLLGAVATALFSGCGGGGAVKEANTYVDDVNRAQNRFADTIDTLST